VHGSEKLAKKGHLLAFPINDIMSQVTEICIECAVTSIQGECPLPTSDVFFSLFRKTIS